MSISSNFDFVPFLFNWVKYWTAVMTLYRKPENINLTVKKKIIITSFDGLTNRPNGSVTCTCFVRSHESKAKQDGDGKRGHNKTKDLISRTIAQHERFNTMLYIYSRPLQNNRDLKQTTTATATRTWKNKRSNRQNNSSARAF